MRWPQDKAFWSRLGVTAAVLAAYYLGTNVPLPGLNSDAVAQLAQATGPSALARVSILSLGVMPLLGTLILIEILKLLAPGVRRWELASAAQSRPDEPHRHWRHAGDGTAAGQRRRRRA